MEENRLLKEENACLKKENEGLRAGKAPSQQQQPPQAQHQPQQPVLGLKQKLLGMHVVNKIEAAHERITYNIHVGCDNLLYTVGEDCTRVWDQNLKMQREIPHSISAGIHINDNSCFLIIGERGPPGGSIQVVNKATWSKLRDFDFGMFSPNDMVTSETHCIVCCSSKVNVVDLDRMQQTETIEASAGVPCVALHGNNVLFYDGGVKVYDLATSKQVKRFDCARASRMIVSDDSLFTASDDGSIHRFDLKTYKEVAKLEGHRPGCLRCLCVDGPALYSGGEALMMWDLTRNALVNSVPAKGQVGAVRVWNGKVVNLDNPDILIWE